MNTPIENILAVFSDYAAIPHPSGNTAAAAAWVAERAREAGAAAEVDEAGNVLIRACATPGYEQHPAVILQGHLDMVAAREPDAPRDPEKEGLLLFYEGDLLGAQGTTLGGDDGAAVALFLALLTDETAAHPPLEILLTADEETGMFGATDFDTSKLTGRVLLNLDSDDEGVLIAGCAGGTKTTVSLPVCREMQEGSCFALSIRGVSGGHSGVIRLAGRDGKKQDLRFFSGRGEFHRQRINIVLEPDVYFEIKRTAGNHRKKGMIPFLDSESRNAEVFKQLFLIRPFPETDQSACGTAVYDIRHQKIAVFSGFCPEYLRLNDYFLRSVNRSGDPESVGFLPDGKLFPGAVRVRQDGKIHKKSSFSAVI